MSLKQLINDIGLEELTNATLVNSGARNAFLLQYIDYGEKNDKGPISAGKLAAIAKQFPELVFTKNRQGMIISRKSYNRNANVNTSAGMGKILDYPCAEEFNSINETKVKYGYDINVWYKPQLGVKNVMQIVGNFCPSKAKQAEFEALATKFRTALKADPLLGKHVIDVVVEVEEFIPEEELLRRVIANERLSQRDTSALDNALFNMGYSDNLTIAKFQLNNPVHRGILISILIHQHHDPLSPFFPIQNSGHEEEILAITAKQEAAIIAALKSTRTV